MAIFAEDHLTISKKNKSEFKSDSENHELLVGLWKCLWCPLEIKHGLLETPTFSKR